MTNKLSEVDPQAARVTTGHFRRSAGTQVQFVDVPVGINAIDVVAAVAFHIPSECEASGWGSRGELGLGVQVVDRLPLNQFHQPGLRKATTIDRAASRSSTVPDAAAWAPRKTAAECAG
jgi:hypothetical protein